MLEINQSQPIAITIKDEFEADKVAPIITVIDPIILGQYGINNPPTLAYFSGNFWW